MKLNEVAHIHYKSVQTGEETDRFVIPTFIPQPHMKALDVTQLSQGERDEVCEWLKEYTEYHQLATSRIYSFEDWIAQTKQVGSPPVKWRTFALANTVEL